MTRREQDLTKPEPPPMKTARQELDGSAIPDATASPESRRQRPTWLSWHWHQRTAAITQEWDIEWIMLDTHRRGLARYVELLGRSLAVLWRLRRSTVIVQSPSLLLAALAVAVAPALRLRLIIDAHNESVRPFAQDAAVIRQLIRLVVRRAELVIVTNDELADAVRAHGGRPFVLPDAIPVAPEGDDRAWQHSMPVVLVICTYAADEPVTVFIETARRLAGVAEIRLTGRPPRKAQELLRTAPANLKALGFLSESDYWRELRNAQCVVDLTLKPNCLVCGGYEAIAVGKSPILSDDVSSRRLFGGVATFVDNTVEGLTSAILGRLAGSEPAGEAIHEFRHRYMFRWRQTLKALSRGVMSPRLSGNEATHS